MPMSDLIPWGRSRIAPALRRDEEASPFLALQREMNRVFDEFFRNFDIPPMPRLGWAGGWPQVDVSENDEEVKIVAELPGLTEKDIAVTLNNGVLTLRGEKKLESNGALYSERWYGQFQRSLELGPEVDPDRVTATFRNGVLTITAAKRPEAQREVKRIPING